MSDSDSLTTVDALEAYLSSSSQSYEDVKLLTGGTANYVYRVSLPDGSTRIYKHAAPYLHSAQSFAFPVERMDYEDQALEILPSLLEKELHGTGVEMHPAKLHEYDREAKLLCIEDGGERNLKDAFTDSSLDIPAIGQEIGTWLAALHYSSKQTPIDISGQGDLLNNNEIALWIYRHSYNNLHLQLSKYRFDPDFAYRINEKFGSRLPNENDHVCHGDFWPGNILVKPSTTGAGKSRLTVVDWEMVRRGTGATDVGQFTAEAWLLDRFRGARGLRAAFLNAYANAIDVKQEKNGKEWMKRMVVHWGVHVAYWGTTTGWTADKDENKELVRIGVETTKVVTREGVSWDELKRTEIFQGVNETWSNWWV